MIPVLVRHLSATLHCLAHDLHHQHRHDDTGATLEKVILILGGMGIAALLVAALYQKIESYIAQIR